MGNKFDYIEKDKSNYQNGIDLQREKFKDAKTFNDTDHMCDAIENIKSEIKDKMMKKQRKKDVVFVEKVILWYRTKEARHIKVTEEGRQIVFPPDMVARVNRNLTSAYEVLISNLEILGLL